VIGLDGSWIWLVGGAALVVAIYLWYATIVARSNKVKEAFASIDVHLRQRHDLVPNLVGLAQRFMDHERTLLERVTELRARVERAGTQPSAERFAAEAALAAGMGRILAVAEGYPDLRSEATLREAQRVWADTEAQIAAARRFYNAAVGALRNAVGIFPGRLLGLLAGVTGLPPFFEAPPEAREAPSVEAMMGPRRG
jgi:LemA protein